MANGITRNEKGKIVRWYNFLVTTDTRKKDCFIDLFKSLNPFSAVLHLDNKDVLDVNYSRFYFENLKSGKIGAFISQVKGTEYYKNSYLNLQVDSDKDLSFPNEPFKVDDEIINDYENQYVSLIKSKLIQ